MKIKSMFASATLIGLVVCTQALAQQSSTDVGAYLSGHGYEAVELTKTPSGHDLLEVTINGRTGLFVLDSGASGTVIHEAFLSKYFEEVGESVQDQKSFGVGGEVRSSRHAIDSFEIDGVSYPLLSVAVLDLHHVVDGFQARAGVTVDGVVGQDVLTNFNGVIDVSNGKLYLEPKKPVE